MSQNPRRSPQQGQPQGAAGGAGGQGGGSGPAGGYGGGGYARGGGFDVEYLREELPLVPGAVAGALSGIFMFAIGLVLAILLPSGTGNGLELGATLLFDLQFATPRHLTPFLYGNFDIVRPPDAALGVLYLIAPLLLYKAAKIVVGFGLEGDVPLQESTLAGASVLLGYFPVMLVAALLVPSGGQFSLVTALVLAGLVYPLLFGALGGLSAGYFDLGERRIGVLYGFVGFLAVYLGLFVTSYAYITIESEFVEFTTVDRLLAAFVTLAQVHGLSYGTPEQAKYVPYLVALVLVSALGFVRAWRSDSLSSPIDGVATAVTPAVTYVGLLGLFVSATVVFADSYIQEELGLGLVFSGLANALAARTVPGIGEYVSFLFTALLVFPVLVGGLGGLVAWYLRDRQRTPS